MRLLLPAVVALCACSSTPPMISPPPVELLKKCTVPELPDLATANERDEFAAAAVQFAKCEHSRSIGLLQAWPRL